MFKPLTFRRFILYLTPISVSAGEAQFAHCPPQRLALVLELIPLPSRCLLCSQDGVILWPHFKSQSLEISFYHSRQLVPSDLITFFILSLTVTLYFLQWLSMPMRTWVGGPCPSWLLGGFWLHHSGLGNCWHLPWGLLQSRLNKPQLHPLPQLNCLGCGPRLRSRMFLLPTPPAGRLPAHGLQGELGLLSKALQEAESPLGCPERVTCSPGLLPGSVTF